MYVHADKRRSAVKKSINIGCICQTEVLGMNNIVNNIVTSHAVGIF